MTAVWCCLPFIGPVTFQLQEPLGNTHIDGIPRQNFLFTVTPGRIKVLIHTALAEGIVPLCVVELFIPAVQSRAVFYSGFNDRAQAAVSTGKHRLQTA